MVVARQHDGGTIFMVSQFGGGTALWCGNMWQHSAGIAFWQYSSTTNVTSVNRITAWRALTVKIVLNKTTCANVCLHHRDRWQDICSQPRILHHFRTFLALIPWNSETVNLMLISCQWGLSRPRVRLRSPKKAQQKVCFIYLFGADSRHTDSQQPRRIKAGESKHQFEPYPQTRYTRLSTTTRRIKCTATFNKLNS